MIQSVCMQESRSRRTARSIGPILTITSSIASRAQRRWFFSSTHRRNISKALERVGVSSRRRAASRFGFCLAANGGGFAIGPQESECVPRAKLRASPLQSMSWNLNELSNFGVIGRRVRAAFRIIAGGARHSQSASNGCGSTTWIPVPGQLARCGSGRDGPAAQLRAPIGRHPLSGATRDFCA
jgi:hypothetical protein